MKSPVKTLLLSLSLAALLAAAPANNEKISLNIDGMSVTDLIKLVAATTQKKYFYRGRDPRQHQLCRQ